MIKQVIVVEGKSDIARVGMAVEADMIATEGFALKKTTIEKIRYAYEKGGLSSLRTPTGRVNGSGSAFPNCFLKPFMPSCLNQKLLRKMMWA